MKKNKNTTNALQDTKQKTKDWATRTPHTTEVMGEMFSFLCIYVLISMLWCLLRFPHRNDVRFVFTPSCAHVLFVVFVFVCKLFKVKIGVTQTPISNRKWTQVFLIRRHCDFHHTIILAFFFFSSIMNFQELLMFILLFTCTPRNSCSSE
jgi:hypothetical protein